jgi:hypothetical protein
MAERSHRETIKVEGGQLVDRVKELIHEGNVRRIVIRQDDRVLAEFPLAFGLVGAVVAPVLAAVGAIAALIANCTIEIERADDVEGDGHVAIGETLSVSAEEPPVSAGAPPVSAEEIVDL